jgi:hypothetical protein
MAQTTVDLIRSATEANHQCVYRKGNLVLLPAQGSLVVSGDLHGHRRNFERIVAFADLALHPTRHILFQEIIHGGPQDSSNGCLSYRLLLDVMHLKLQFPKQVHFIMGNHDTTYISDAEVMKDGREMNRCMHQAMQREYSDSLPQVKEAMQQFFLSQALGLRTENRIWMSHSLPADRLMNDFDLSIFKKKIELQDCVKPGSAYILTWGRRMSQALLDRLANMLNVDLFLLGHQPQMTGWGQAGNNLLIIASDHNHGCLVHIDLEKAYSMDDLIRTVVPLSSIE